MMTIRGQVVNSSGGQPLPYATVQDVDDEGYTTGGGVQAGADGKFETTTSSAYIVITYAGFQPLLFETAALSAGNYPLLGLMASGDLSPVTVTAHKKTNYWPWAIAAAVAYYALK